MLQRILLLSTLIIITQITLAQINPKGIVATDNQFLYAGLDNRVQIMTNQGTPVCVEQLNAFMQSGKSGEQVEIRETNNLFIIHPQRAGILQLSIDLGDTIEVQKLHVKTIIPVGQLGKYKANSNATLEVEEMKAQRGIFAIIECCGFDAKCTVVSYELIRVSKQGEINKTINLGGKFEAVTQNILHKTSSGDMYIFRKLKYRCPGMMASQYLENMVFDIR